MPLSRYVVQHQNEISFPFQVTQIGRNFRGERAQKGRFRELYQCDVDIIGREKLPTRYDAKIIACIYAALSTFDLPKMRIRINNRKLVSGFIKDLGLEDKAGDISFVIDHAEKVPIEKTKAALTDLGIAEDKVEALTTFMFTHGKIDEVKEALTKLVSDPVSIEEGITELQELSDILNAQGLCEAFEIDCMIVRGLDYYTGTVYEVFLDDYRQLGSISGGGRYENLCSNFSNKSFPGVGGSIGLTRLFYILQANNLIQEDQYFPVNFVLIPLSKDELKSSFYLADKLRQKNFTVDIDFNYERKLGDRIKRASNVSSQAVIIGESEAESGSFQVKDLITGTTKALKF